MSNFVNHKFTKFVIFTSLILLPFLFLSCDVETSPTSSTSIAVFLNGEDITSAVFTHNLIPINLDAEKQADDLSYLGTKGFLEIRLNHFDQSGNTISVNTTFESPDIKLTKRNENTTSLVLDTASLPIGVYTVKCNSEAGDKYSKQFDFWIYSAVTSISASYTIQDPLPEVEYKNTDEMSAKSGTITGSTGCIYLATNTVYNFEISATNNASLGTLEYSSAGSDSSSRPLLRWTGSDKDKKSLVTSSVATSDEAIEAYKKKGTTDGLPTITISLKGTDLVIKRYVILRTYLQADIIETEGKEDNTKYISLNKDDGVKYFSVSLTGTVSDGSLQFSLTEGSQNSSKPVIPTSGWSNNQTTYGTFNGTTYFDLYFNGTNKTIKITPQQDTVYNNKNIDFYLHIKDSAGNYLGYWKILVGGVVESVKLSVSELSGNPGKSGTLKAEVFPHTASATVLFYVSDRPYSGAGTTLSSADPSTDLNSKTLLSMLPSPSYRTSATGETYTVCFKNHNGKAEDYYYANAAAPGLVNGISTLVYSLGTITGKAYLTALVCTIDSQGYVTPIDNYTIFTSIPITISSSGEIAFRSVISVNKTITDSDKTYKLDPYTEDGQQKELPSRPDGQYYPLNAEENAYGVATRSFYFPHNAYASINIDMYGVEPGEFTLSPDTESEKLFTVTKNEATNGVVLSITPKWFQYWNDYNININTTAQPPTKKGEQKKGYGYFTDYIGVGNVYFNVKGSAGRLRIVIYDNNKYAENLIN